MTPEEIIKHFGRDALDKLYDSILQNPVHALADWVLSYHTEEQVGKWIAQLTLDEMEGESNHD